MNHAIRRALALLLSALLLTGGARAVVSDAPQAAEPDVYHIMEAEEDAVVPKVAAYAGQFADVSSEQWFYPYVAASYEYGLIRGRSADSFAPAANVTVAELLTLSARIHAAWAGDAIDPDTGGVWYAPYVSYLAAQGLLDASLTDYSADANRAQLAAIFALSLPEGCFDARNAMLITDAYASGAYITDVDEYTPYQPQILWLYRQGLLTGTDSSGRYLPDKPTSRAEVAAVVTRMVDPSLRVTPDWVVVPSWSAAGTTLADLVTAPDAVSTAPEYTDGEAIDALVRKMLSEGGNTISLRYPRTLTQSDAQTLATLFNDRVKGYCEQMYNAVLCQRYLNSGLATLTFYATACAGRGNQIRSDELERYRDETMAKAIEIHDMLWESGQLTADMTQYEIARVCYLWLCDHCEYDWAAASDEYSVSHIAYSALLLGKSVCDGYTGAYNLLLKLEGIDCYALPSIAANHIWTVATLDGEEYHIDVTWGDQTGRIDMRYFGMSAEQSRAAHPW